MCKPDLDPPRSTLFRGSVSRHALAGSLPLEQQGSPDAATEALRKEGSAQQGVSSLPLHVQIIACPVHSGGEGGPQKHICEPAGQFRRVGLGQKRAGTAMHRVVPDELLVLFVCEREPTSPVAGHVAEGPRVDGVHVSCPGSGALPPLRSQSAEFEGHLMHVWHSRNVSWILNAPRDVETAVTFLEAIEV